MKENTIFFVGHLDLSNNNSINEEDIHLKHEELEEIVVFLE
jgi:hypothetical protein